MDAPILISPDTWFHRAEVVCQGPITSSRKIDEALSECYKWKGREGIPAAFFSACF
jgi:hypothetical protein